MSALGVRLSVMAGKTIPLPLPEPVVSRLRSVKVTETDTQRSAFTLVFDAGRSGPAAAFDVPLMAGAARSARGCASSSVCGSVRGRPCSWTAS